jgi:hypothetical protein
MAKEEARLSLEEKVSVPWMKINMEIFSSLVKE